MNIDRLLLEKVATELNDVVGLSPKININIASEHLFYLIKKAATLVMEEDVFSEDVQKIIQPYIVVREKEWNAADIAIPDGIDSETVYPLEDVATPEEVTEHVAKLQKEENAEYEKEESQPEGFLVSEEATAPDSIEVSEEVTAEAPSSESELPQQKKKVGSKRKPHVTKIENYIEEGKFTAKEIVDKVFAEFPDKNKETLMMCVRSSKNEKYTSFKGRLAQEKDGIFSFIN